MSDHDCQAKCFHLFGQQVEQYNGIDSAADSRDNLASISDQPPSPAEFVKACNKRSRREHALPFPQ
jgi:hypothetical protein